MRYRKDDYRSALQVCAEARKVMIGEIRPPPRVGQAPPCYIWAADLQVRVTSGGATVKWRRLILTKQKSNRMLILGRP